MTQVGETVRVGIYLRISDDRDGTQTATERQRQDCIKYAESRGWEVVDVFEDVDLSAYKRKVKRPEFERMLTSVRELQVDRVLAWKVDRLTRRMRDIVRLDDACEEVGAYISTVVENIDTQQPTGRFVLELLVAQARMESENASVRIKRKEAERAAKGLPSTGGYRLYGYTKDRSAVIPEEALLVREAATRILAGETLGGVCWDWKRRGVVSVLGGAWSKHVLRGYLLRPAVAGFREHEGLLVKGTWPGIISEVEHRRLVAVLTDPARLTRVTARRYLLTGIVRCGRCQQPMVGRPRDDKTPRYVCNKQPQLSANCGALTRLCGPVDDLVKHAIFDFLDGVDLSEFVEGREDTSGVLVEALREDEESLAQLHTDYYVEKAVDRVQFMATRGALQDRIRSRRQQLARQSGRSMLSELAGQDIRAMWDEKGIDWQRAVIAALIAAVELLPARRGYNQFDPTKVRIEWRA